MIILVADAHVLSVQSAHHVPSSRVVTRIRPLVVVAHDAGLTRSVRIEFEEAHEQGQRFAQVVSAFGPKVDGVMRPGFAGTCLEGPNVSDL